MATLLLFEISARFVSHILSFVKDTALIENTVSVHFDEGFSQSSTAIAYDHLQPLVGSHPAFPEALQERFPFGMIFPFGQLPIENLSPAVGPEAERHEDHDLFPAALWAFSLTLVELDLSLLALDRDPHAVTLDYRWCFWELLFSHAMNQGIDLIDELIATAEPNPMFSLSTPAILDRPQALAQATPEKGILVHIYPKPLKFLQNTELANDIMMTVLALQHGDPQMIDMPQFGLQRSLVMPVSRELMSILTAALSAFPVNFAGLLTRLTWTAFFPSSFCRYFCFQTGHYSSLACLQSGFFDLFLDCFNDLFAFFPFDTGWRNCSTHGR